MTFRPINDDHAIEQVVFTLHFGRSFGDADLSTFRLNHFIWSEDLPALREAQGLTMGLLADKSMRAESIPGVEFAYLRPNGSPIWSLRVLGTDVTVECTRYSRWAKVWAAARTHLDNVLGLIERTGIENDLKRVSFVVQDAFTASSEDYDLRSLLKASAFVPASVFANGANWHSHCGWFEEVEGHRLLQNINLDAVGGEMAVAASGAAARVAIVHIQSATRKDGAANAKAQSEWLDEVMNVMHRRNLETVLQLIEGGMLDRIGLSGGADE